MGSDSVELLKFFSFKFAIDLLSLCVLFSHYTPCDDGTPENCFCQMSSYSRAYVYIINEKTKGKFPGEHHMV